MNKETKEIKNMTKIEELQKKLADSQRAYLDLRVDNKLRKLKNVKEITIKRKQIAILRTKIREKELSNAR